ncbi:peptidase M24, structural domain-containing protein [Syncephalis fuscata]|nr:peptidase M24, structural domain-containing protein [Syncephalis fuscata]
MQQQICKGEACGQPAKLQCPTCVKLKIAGSFFCSQDCFKKNWAQHKAVHTESTGPVTQFNPWPTYNYTGTARPVYPIGERRHVPEHIPRPDYAEDGLPKSEMNIRGSTKIEILSPEEIEIMRHVCRMAREVLDEGARAIKVGVTTDEIDRIVHEATISRDAYPSPLNYYNFPKSCCTSINEVICHGIPDGRPLQDGDILNIDVSIYYNGFHADLNETYLVGDVDEKGKKLVQNARECLEKAIAIVKPGTLYRDLGSVIEKHAKSAGNSVVRTYCGHGVHRLFHCSPNVPHYAKNKAIGVMQPGHVFTIEPMINEGTWHDTQWPDNWTAVTADGKRSAQFEHTMVVTETGVEIL